MSVIVTALALTAAACSGGGSHPTTSPTTTSAPAPGGSTTTTTTTTTFRAGAPTVPAIPAPTPLTCPARAPVSVPHHQRAGTATTLVPRTPVGLLACRYHGFNQPQPIGAFARSARLSPTALAGAIDAMPRTPAGAVFNCPNDAGEVYTLYFFYRDGPPLLVRIEHGGCGTVTNGDLTVMFPPPTVTLPLVAALGQDPV